MLQTGTEIRFPTRRSVFCRASGQQALSKNHSSCNSQVTIVGLRCGPGIIISLSGLPGIRTATVFQYSKTNNGVPGASEEGNVCTEHLLFDSSAIWRGSYEKSLRLLPWQVRPGAGSASVQVLLFADNALITTKPGCAPKLASASAGWIIFGRRRPLRWRKIVRLPFRAKRGGATGLQVC